jgi:small subunit ribosomal protein S17
VERLVRHPIYHKTVKRRKKFKAHDEHNRCGVGDKVLIIESRPLSRDKRWRVKEILAKAL